LKDAYVSTVERQAINLKALREVRYKASMEI